MVESLIKIYMYIHNIYIIIWFANVRIITERKSLFIKFSPA